MFRQLKRAGAGERCQAMQTGHLRCRALVVPPVLGRAISGSNFPWRFDVGILQSTHLTHVGDVTVIVI